MTTDQQRLFEAAGMDCGFYRNLILPRSAPRNPEKTTDLLWVSRCQPIKRPLLFCDLAAALPHARCRMVCPREDVGLWETVRARAAEVPNLEFIERIPYHEIQAAYDDARIFVNTSEWEGWPNSFIQAGLGHTALLSLDVNPDALFEKFALGTFAASDFHRLAQAAAQMLAAPATLATMQQESARFVAEMHDNTRETDRFLAGLPMS
jgi:glycosyltransferase involved in cell wall biosynthesis